MLRAAFTFFVIAILAMLLGASGIAGMSIEIGRTLLLVFLVLSGLSLLGGLLIGRSTKQIE